VQICSTVQINSTQTPTFDRKFKVIIRTDFTNDYFEQIDWVNSNSIGLVEVRNMSTSSGINTYKNDIYFAFEDPSDATYFKIKYSL
jgi:hypothetical protein